MLTTNLSSGLRPGQNLEDNTGLEFGFESTMFLHLWIPLSGLYAVDRKLSSFWGPLHRSQVQSSSRKPYSVAPCASNSGNDSNSSRVSFGVAPFRSRACKAFSPPSRTAFIHLLTA